jgi:type VI secretion system protein ImpK
MEDDDKTIIVYSGGDSDEGTQVNSTFAAPPTFQQKEVLPQAESHFDTTFLERSQSQPFLVILRALYREVYRLEKRENQTEIQTLKRKLIQITDHHTRLLAEQGYENTHIMIVRYVLSTFIDELLGTMEWGDGAAWANHSLLGHYYKETYGGEKFFQLLEQFVQEPGKYLQHMKLVYVCLSLGYKGRYSLSESSEVQVEGIRQELYSRIKNFDTQEDKFYKDHPVSTKKHKLTLHIPYRLFIIGGIVIMAIVYGIFSSMVMQNEEDLMQILKQTPLTKKIKDQNGRQ